ncbi:MAG: hypothetical protein MJ106_07140 [Lentisphaeria bacterium]|nr:hypothetical protein [Lentisphaeria bacterium]
MTEVLLAALVVFAVNVLQGADSSAPSLQQKTVQADEKAPVKTWTNSGEMQLSFAAARVRVISKYEGAGFTLKHEISMGKRNTRCLMLWEKGDVKTIVMLWKIDVGRTGFSTGEMNDGEK